MPKDRCCWGGLQQGDVETSHFKFLLTLLPWLSNWLWLCLHSPHAGDPFGSSDILTCISLYCWVTALCLQALLTQAPQAVKWHVIFRQRVTDPSDLCARQAFWEALLYISGPQSHLEGLWKHRCGAPSPPRVSGLVDLGWSTNAWEFAFLISSQVRLLLLA